LRWFEISSKKGKQVWQLRRGVWIMTFSMTSQEVELPVAFAGCREYSHCYVVSTWILSFNAQNFVFFFFLALRFAIRTLVFWGNHESTHASISDTPHGVLDDCIARVWLGRPLIRGNA
jgi:hypothetical protein